MSSKVTLVVKNLPANAGDARDTGVIPGLGRFPGEGNGNPLPGRLQSKGSQKELDKLILNNVRCLPLPHGTLAPAGIAFIFSTPLLSDFQRQNSIHYSILIGRRGEKQINTHSLNTGLFAFRWDNKKQS